MEYRKMGASYYLRMDKGDEVIGSILDVCAREGVRSATFSGIGGCESAEIQVFEPERGTFKTERAQGVLELVSLMGNVIWAGGEALEGEAPESGVPEGGASEGEAPEGALSYHAHALFAYRDGDAPLIAAGHLKSAVVLYTAEVELRPVEGGVIEAALNEETGTNFWHFGA